jgi:uncharacterized protein (TIGR02118 family)
MVKLIYCITKKKNLTDEEFFRYWRDVHGPLGGGIPGLRKLVQSRRIPIPGDKFQPDYDGMAELWFDTIEDLLAARQSPEWKASSDDEANFIDHSNTAYFVTEEHAVVQLTKRKLAIPRLKSDPRFHSRRAIPSGGLLPICPPNRPYVRVTKSAANGHTFWANLNVPLP